MISSPQRSNEQLNRRDIPLAVAEETSPERLIVDDWHTHLLGPRAGSRLSLYGIDHQLTYHYVRRKLFGGGYVDPDTFYSWDIEKQGDFTWQTLFVDAPSDCFDEGCRGVVVAMEALGLDPNSATLDQARQFYADTDPEEIQSRCMSLSGVRRMVGTQDVFNDEERDYYEQGEWDESYLSGFRLDELVLHYPRAMAKLSAWGYNVESDPTQPGTAGEIRRFLYDWHARLPNVVYGACSFPPHCQVHDISTMEGSILHHAVLPVLKDLESPFFMMPGPIRQLQSQWREAGDGAGLSDMRPYQELVRRHQENAFFITPLHNANQYDASVMTCHNHNVMAIGHWWFNYHPGLVETDLRMRLEMTGDRFVPFNSDARVLENLIPKWRRFRQILAKVLTEKYLDLHDAGRRITRAGMARTLDTLFDPNRFFNGPIRIFQAK